MTLVSGCNTQTFIKLDIAQVARRRVSTRNITFLMTEYKYIYLGKTALQWSAQYGHIQVVEYLVDHDADVNISDRYGEYRVYQS